MKLSGNRVLITGGASGIGLGLAKEFVKAGSQVIACGRRADQLKEAKQICPQLHTIVADVSTASGREDLFQQATGQFKDLNVLINNAGIQNRPPKLLEKQDWFKHAQEIETNLAAPIHLSILFASYFTKQKNAAIVNVSSGLAFSPLAFIPTYCATKAALHSFTLSLRHQLKDTSVEVIEIIPPAVNTDLGGKGLHDFGVPLNDFISHIVQHLAAGDLEMGYQFSEKGRRASRAELDELFVAMNNRA